MDEALTTPLWVRSADGPDKSSTSSPTNMQDLLGQSDSALASVVDVALPLSAMTSDLCSHLMDLQRRVGRTIALVPRPECADDPLAPVFTRTNLRLCRIDAIQGWIQYDAEDPVPLSDLALDEALAQHWEILVIAAHGEGSHAKIGRIVVCGLAGGKETLLSGEDGECRPGHCKRGARSKVIYTDALQARVLVLLSCYGLSVAGEGYPSDVSLVRGVVSARRVESIVTTIRGVEVGDVLWRAFNTAVRDLATPSDLVRQLNEMQRGRGLPDTFVLVGGGSSPWNLQRSAGGTVQVPKQPEEYPDQYATAVVDLLSRAVRGTLWRTEVSNMQDDLLLSQVFAEKASREKLLNASVVSAAHWGHTTAGTRDWIMPYVAAWRDDAWRLISNRGVAYGLDSTLRSVSVPVYHETVLRICSRCGSRAEFFSLQFPLSSVRGEAMDCPICGPISCWAGRFRSLRVEVPGKARRGEDLSLTVEARSPAASSTECAVEIQHKGTGAVYFSSQFVLSNTDTASFDIDTSALSLDLHTVRVVALGQDAISFERRRFAVVP